MFVEQRTAGRRPKVFHAPDTLDEAAALLEEHHGDVRVAGGATYVMLMASHGEVQPTHLVSLHRIPGLETLEPGHLGALVTLRRLERWSRTGPERALTMGAAVVAGPLVRTLGTVGGNVGFSDGDLVAPLMALNARVQLHDGRALPVAEFVEQRPAAIITDLHYAARAADGWSAATVKLAHRGMDWPIVTVAVALQRDDDGTVVAARAAAQALAPTPTMLPGVEAVLVGSQGEPEAIDYAAEAATHRIEIREDAEASAAHRKRVAPAVVARALEIAFEAGPDGAVELEEAWR